MELHSLKPASGSIKKDKRIARGQGSGHGGTSTRGHKGDKARSGSKTKRHFEGGQTPIQRRLPKVGFKNINRVEYVPVNLSQLQYLADKLRVSEITMELLWQQDMYRRGELVKILAHGELTTKLSVVAHAASEKAKAAIEAAGGSLNLVNAG
jgi:large subunit ribosomal protein L15